MSPVGGYFNTENSSRAVSLLADPRFTRAWPGGVGDRKMGSNYGPTIHVQKEAASKGLQQVLWLYGPDHEVTEVGPNKLHEMLTILIVIREYLTLGWHNEYIYALYQ